MHNQQKTLVILSPAFPADHLDSGWVPPKQLFVKKLRENFPHVKIIVLSFLYPCYETTYSWHGAEVISFNGMHKRKLRRLVLWYRIWRTLQKIHRQESILGIYSFWCGECALIGRYFARWHRLKHFCWISGMDAMKKNKLVKWIRPSPHELVAMSVFLVNEFHLNHGIKPGRIIPIGIDPAEFGQPPVLRDIDVLGVGSFNPLKQYDVFIHAINDLSTTFPSIKAVICGDGTERESLLKLIRQLGLENNITLTGMLPHSEVLQYMQRAKLFLHPSAYEGFGAVCLEALYAGAQVISFCDPMKMEAPHWHIANSPEEMTQKAYSLLAAPYMDQLPVLLYSMDDSAKAVMKLFGLPGNKAENG